VQTGVYLGKEFHRGERELRWSDGEIAGGGGGNGERMERGERKEEKKKENSIKPSFTVSLIDALLW
jgi:hypothetical protein